MKLFNLFTPGSAGLQPGMKSALLLLLLLFVVILTGCVTKNATITEYNDAGKIIKVTETSQQDAVGKIMKEMEKKNIVIWKRGWFFVGEITVTGTETYMPCLKFAGGKLAKGHLSIKDGTADIPAIIDAVNAPLDVTINKDGLKAKESDKNKSVPSVAKSESEVKDGSAVDKPATL
jgi:hypothetical protein